jgi:hypothetical protein
MNGRGLGVIYNLILNIQLANWYSIIKKKKKKNVEHSSMAHKEHPQHVFESKHHAAIPYHMKIVFEKVVEVIFFLKK